MSFEDRPSDVGGGDVAFDYAVIAHVHRLVERCERLVESTPWTRQADDPAPDRLPDMSEEAAWRRSSKARDLLEEFRALDPGTLPTDLRATLALVQHVLQQRAHEGDWYWTVFDPSQSGLYSMFAPTAYGGGFVLNVYASMLGGFHFTHHGDVDRYCGLVADVGRLIKQFANRTSGQAQRGIRMPVAQHGSSRTLVERMLRGYPALLAVSAERLAQVGGEASVALIQQRIERDVYEALQHLHEVLFDPENVEQTSDQVGLAQYAGGEEIYAELVRQHTTLAKTPSEVHQVGLARMARLQDEIQAVLRSVSHSRLEDYLREIATDDAWRESDAQGVAARIRGYMAKAQGAVSSQFSHLPNVRCEVAPLPDALQGAMSFGYYEAPNMDRRTGTFWFNPSNLTASPLLTLPSLVFHEIVPGHHLHHAGQRDNAELSHIRRGAAINAFAEGWAEYAAGLAGELGLYSQPQERLGRLMMDSMLTCRLVVDTGMHALGWTLEQARGYMRSHSFLTEAEVCSESLRYGFQVPGQALAYKLGDDFLFDLRAEMRRLMGASFDIRLFHDAVLSPGALPLPAVRQNVLSKARELIEPNAGVDL